MGLVAIQERGSTRVGPGLRMDWNPLLQREVFRKEWNWWIGCRCLLVLGKGLSQLRKGIRYESKRRERGRERDTDDENRQISKERH